MLTSTASPPPPPPRHYLEVHQLSSQVDQWKLTAEHKQIELQQLREETQNALIAQARTEGELRAQNPHAVPKTTLTERIAILFISPAHWKGKDCHGVVPSHSLSPPSFALTM